MLQAWTLILSCASSKSLDFIIIAKARVELNLVQVLRQDVFFGFRKNQCYNPDEYFQQSLVNPWNQNGGRLGFILIFALKV
jgi:hypothetical protein